MLPCQSSTHVFFFSFYPWFLPFSIAYYVCFCCRCCQINGEQEIGRKRTEKKTEGEEEEDAEKEIDNDEQKHETRRIDSIFPSNVKETRKRRRRRAHIFHHQATDARLSNASYRLPFCKRDRLGEKKIFSRFFLSFSRLLARSLSFVF